MTKRRDPKYRHHKARNLAVVRIDGKDYYLGRYGSEESRTKYHRLLADWRAGLLNHDESTGRFEGNNQHGDNAISIADLVSFTVALPRNTTRKMVSQRNQESRLPCDISSKHLVMLPPWISGQKH